MPTCLQENGHGHFGYSPRHYGLIVSQWMNSIANYIVSPDQFKPIWFTVPFNNMRTLKLLKAQLTNAFFATTINCLVAPRSLGLCCLNRDQWFYLIATCLAVVESWEESPIHLIEGSQKVFVGWGLSLSTEPPLHLGQTKQELNT